MEPTTVLFLGAFSVFVGLLIGCVGIGGVLLVPFLIYAIGMDIHFAISVAMFGYIFVGTISAILYARHGSIQWSMALWMIAGAMPAAFLGAFLASVIPAIGLELLVSVLVFLAGINALRRKKASIVERNISNPLALLVIGAITGVGSALTGTGGPLVVVPILVSLNVAAHTAIGLSQAVQMPLATLATIGNFSYGNVDMFIGGIVACGLVFGGAGGSKLAHLIPPATMSRIVAWILVLVGLFLLFKLSLKIV